MANFNTLYYRAIADQKLRYRYEYEFSVELDRNSESAAVKDATEINPSNVKYAIVIQDA